MVYQNNMQQTQDKKKLLGKNFIYQISKHEHPTSEYTITSSNTYLAQPVNVV